jgi:oligoendopeptidase F
MTDVSTELDAISKSYVALHTEKEDLFWVTKMGLAEDATDARKRAARAEQAWHAFVQDPDRLRALRRLAEEAGTDDERRLAAGWIAMLEAHVVEDKGARKLAAELVELEAELERARGEMELGYVDPATGELVRASSVKLGLLQRTHDDERVRRAAFDGLCSIERFVLENGLLAIFAKRNALARMLGYEDFYAWRVGVVERMTKARLFSVLDDLAQRTEASMRTSLAAFAAAQGDRALEPWNFGFLRTGDLTRRLDPHFAFAEALERWGRSFFALGVRYRGATLTLDLVDRPGKYENGFMHGPEPAFYDRGTWRPARINFTANAVVGQVGAGYRALGTLFHEGGHAAHFANVTMDAPCFSQEFAPTSVAYAEAQSMFMDSLVDDAAWRVRYARGPDGEPMPMELVEESIRDAQPFLGWEQRAMLTIPFAERAIYELSDEERTADRILEVCRDVERRLQGLSLGTRPVLAVPHLLAGEASAYYHGYVLAEMAVHQTRRHFVERDGHLVDNPRVGPELAERAWSPGNSVSFDATLEALTGAPLSADALVASCNQTVEQVIAEERASVERLREIPERREPVELDAIVRVAHGRDIVATTERGGFDGACSAFHEWALALERGARG